MSDISHSIAVAPRGHASSRNQPLIGAILATLVAVVIQQATAQGPFELIADDGMRLVQIRDWLGGQGWFDMSQYRLGIDGGTAMHWSRLVDAPIGAIILIAGSVTGDAALAETIAAYVWPALLLFLAVWAAGTAARRIGSEAAVMPAVVIAGVALGFPHLFKPGAFDHHNLQVVLGLWMFAALVARENVVANHAFAGVLAVMMLAIGMETLPYVAIAGLWVAAAFLVGWIRSEAACAFGLGLPIAALAVMGATVPPARYLSHACDGYSLFHVTMASTGGLGLALATIAGDRIVPRMVCLAAAGALLGGLALTVFAHCFDDPLASLDPNLIAFWLDMIIEAQSIADHMNDDPSQLIGLFGMPLTALIVASFIVVRAGDDHHLRTAMALCVALLVTSIAVTAWQQRASIFSTAFALAPMALLVVSVRARYLERQTPRSIGLLVFTWIIAMNTSWWLTTAATSYLTSSEAEWEQQLAEAENEEPQCFDPEGLAQLGALGGALLAAPFNGAVPILLETDQRVLAGNYHRNTAGNLAWIEMMTSAPERAHDIARERGVTHIVSCSIQPDAAMFADRAPDGLQARLDAGDVPDWLVAVPVSHEAPLAIYRVVSPAASQ